MKTTLQIGEFARLTGLSVKTLRFYASEGLLVPSYVDSATGYRYYTQAQTVQANRVLNLREAGMSLAAIRSLLMSSHTDISAWRDTLGHLREALRRDLVLTQLRLQAVDLLLGVLDSATPELLGNIRIVLQQPEFALVKSVPVSERSVGVTEMFERAEYEVAQFDGRASRAPFLQSSNDELSVCVPVKDTIVDAVGAEQIGESRLVVSCVHRGSYDDLHESESLLRGIAKQAGINVTDEWRHSYRRFGAEQEGYQLPSGTVTKNRSRYITDISIPLKAEDDTAVKNN